MKKDKRVTALVILVSCLGILYFGYRAVSESLLRETENPFEFSVKGFESVDPALIRYEETQRITLGPEGASALAVGPDDNIYVSGPSSVTVFTRAGRSIRSVPIEESVSCLAVDSNGEIYCGFDGGVAVYGVRDELRLRWDSPVDGSIFTSLALSPNFVFVADAGHRIVWRFDRDGQNPLRIGDPDPSRDVPGFIIPSPYFDVAVDPDGFLWAANTGRHSLENYSLEGSFRTSWGEASMEIEGFSGCCNPSHFSILEDGSFITSEKGLPRIKVYNRLGRLEAVVAGPDRFIEGTVGLDLAVDLSQRIVVLDPARKLVRIFEEMNTDQEKES